MIFLHTSTVKIKISAILTQYMKNQTSHYSGYLIFAVPCTVKTKEKDVKTCTRNENTNILSCSVLSLTF